MCFDLGMIRGLLRFLDFLLLKSSPGSFGSSRWWWSGRFSVCSTSSKGSVSVKIAAPASAFYPSSQLRFLSLLSFIPLTERTVRPLLVASQVKTSEMLLIEDWLLRDSNLCVLPLLSLGILVVPPNEAIRCMLRDKKVFIYLDDNAQVPEIFFSSVSAKEKNVVSQLKLHTRSALCQAIKNSTQILSIPVSQRYIWYYSQYTKHNW